jgi:hypothetical protein
VTRETHEAPISVQERLRRAGGTNLYGEPNFRVVWGGLRLTWIGGRWVDRDSNDNVIREIIELRQVPKYVPHDRWHIERWTPAEAYGSPDRWYAQTLEIEDGMQIPALGPYPYRGEYEHCFTLQRTDGAFMPLDEAACDWIVRAMEWSRRQTGRAKRQALIAREDRRETDIDRAIDEMFYDS